MPPPPSSPVSPPAASGSAPLVSVVIVCLNNPAMLAMSLPSIQKHTSVPVEVFVVAYLFSPENLALVRKTYPWVEFIESGEIRGFSENNNLALRRARGKYCFVVNDDTCWDAPLIDELVAAFERLPPSAAVVSPVIRWPDGRVQFCGRGPSSLVRYFFQCFGLEKLYRPAHPEFVGQKGLFRTFNLSGACFLAKREPFEECGWFDERFFFCPEDVALSQELNRRGWTCHVLESATVCHLAGGTMHLSDTILATKPATTRGLAIMYADRGFLPWAAFTALSVFNFSWRTLAWLAAALATRGTKAKRMARANWNSLAACFSRKTPKQLFVEYYRKRPHATRREERPVP